MLDPSDSSSQGSFYDPEYVCDHLIPSDSFYRRFGDIVSPLITDDLFTDMYCPDNGRPPIAPSLRYTKNQPRRFLRSSHRAQSGWFTGECVVVQRRAQSHRGVWRKKK